MPIRSVLMKKAMRKISGPLNPTVRSLADEAHQTDRPTPEWMGSLRDETAQRLHTLRVIHESLLLLQTWRWLGNDQ